MADKPHAERPVWWTRREITSFSLSEEDAWRLVDAPPWRCVLAWVTRDCKPVACAMAYVVLDGKIMLTSTGNRDKVKALHRNPAVSVCIQGKGLKQVTIRGRADLSNDPEMVRRWVQAHLDTWPEPHSIEQRERAAERYFSPDRWIITIVPDKVRSFDGEKMFRIEMDEDSRRSQSAKDR